MSAARWSVLVLLVASCGGDDQTDAGIEDAATADFDAGDTPTRDAGAGDAGDTRPDSGVPVDSGALVDSGATADSGATVDSGPAAVPDCGAHTFMHDGVRRAYILCVPDPLPAGPMPVVLGFHGGGGRAIAWQRALPWEELGARDGFAVVFMQGCREGATNCAAALGLYSWNVGKPGETNTVDDQGYTLEVITRLTTVHALMVDAGRVFATGHSLGGMFAYSLRCDHPDVFAAIGPISASPSDGTCSPSGNASIYHVHGASDPNVPFHTGCCSAAQRRSGDPAYLPACAALPRCFNGSNWWPPVRDGAHPFADLIGLEEIATGSLECGLTRTPIAARPMCVRYDACRSGTAVEECLIVGAGHGLGAIDGVFDVREYLWGRFRTH